MKKQYQELPQNSVGELLRDGAKTKKTLCPKCKRGNNVYHIMPWDYKKVCTKCEITWMEDNY